MLLAEQKLPRMLFLPAQLPALPSGSSLPSSSRSSARNLKCRAAADATAPAPQAKPSRKRVPGSGCKIIGTGSAVPSRVISNDLLSSIVDTSDEWIATRTGIRNRRVLSGDEALTQLGTEAGRQALAMAGVEPQDVDLLLLCTSSPDDIFGGACLVQRELGCSRAVAFDLTAACSGFVLGLVTASRFIFGGGYQNVLVIGADALSRYVDWTDRGTCILFGDACGAVLVRATTDSEEGSLLGFDMNSDGQGSRHLSASIVSSHSPPSQEASAHPVTNGKPSHLNGKATEPAASALNGAAVERGAEAASAAPAGVAVAVAEEEEGASTLGGTEPELPGRAQPVPIKMNGREVYKFAVTAVPQVLQSAMEEAQVSAADIDWLLLHQANQRILDAVAQKMGIPGDKVISNVANYGNTSAASIPLALDEAVRKGQVKKGDLLAMAGFGAGLTWAGAVVRFG